MKRHFFVWSSIALVLSLAATTGLLTFDAASKTKRTLYSVNRVVDGDTIYIKMGKKTEKIRVIGINSPEWTTKKECYGDKATAYAKKLLKGKRVFIVQDKTQEKRDIYGRLLAYVGYDNSVDFGKKMIQAGMAKEYTYAKKYQRTSSYKLAQTNAKKGKRGMWAPKACPAKSKSSAKKSAKTTAKRLSSSSPAVKMSRSKICHAKNSRYYKQTIHFKSYKDVGSCLKAGGRLPK